MSFGEKFPGDRAPFALHPIRGYVISTCVCLICDNLLKKKKRHVFLSPISKCGRFNKARDWSLVVEQRNDGVGPRTSSPILTGSTSQIGLYSKAPPAVLL